MIIGIGTIYLRANWVHSLKEKRMIVKSITAKVRNKFNVSIAEVENQDIHQSIVLGIASVSNDSRYANSVIQNVLDYIESNTEAVVEDITMEIL
ncbi:hypothetical protein CLLI_24320 [Clostridium liquoris]|jgi:hypothetical protein|uniref:DUF503 domain-containing protein n=1 Tax=Clostridium liquoris TaxID=1289519 RepID=A0A2T0B0Z1_9CLOT|nr:DUF503 domain-containing protein [Clostridium liquoris]PRR77262.1 hypothetical protein CLLI_24320 [Clostridium liquoris]